MTHEELEAKVLELAATLKQVALVTADTFERVQQQIDDMQLKTDDAFIRGMAEWLNGEGTIPA